MRKVRMRGIRFLFPGLVQELFLLEWGGVIFDNFKNIYIIVYNINQIQDNSRMMDNISVESRCIFYRASNNFTIKTPSLNLNSETWNSINSAPK